MKEKFYKIAPHFIQNWMVSIFNYLAYKKRYGGKYNAYLKELKDNQRLPLKKLKQIQEKEFQKLLQHAILNSKFYKDKYSNLKLPESIDDINISPIINKEELRKNINEVYTLSKNNGIVSKTGGTTGKSLEVIFTDEDMQKRFATLDYFRSWYGYQLGKKTAWFSGKSLLNKKDIKKNRFWKTDYLYKVRYYSTFHINEKYLGYYLKNIIKFQPEYMVGFPSSIIEIAQYGIRHQIDFPKGIIKAIFSTAETVTDEIRTLLSTYFHTKVLDQYASSEGAPFIYECPKGNLHIELQSGVFEVLNEQNQPVDEGRLVVTSFTTYGTPLIRYDIGDRLKLSTEKCACGNNNPLAESILGRIDDYIYSTETGKINLGNISNTLKGVKGIVKFQVVQDNIDEIIIKMVVDKDVFNKSDRSKFISNWRDRLGNKMSIKLQEVNEIPVEKSGKFRMIKNNIKHLI